MNRATSHKNVTSSVNKLSLKNISNQREINIQNFIKAEMNNNLLSTLDYCREDKDINNLTPYEKNVRNKEHKRRNGITEINKTTNISNKSDF